VAASPQGSRPWWTLAGACIGLFLLMLDSTVVNLALPAIQAELDASSSELQWVMNGYLLTIAAAVVTAGRLGDMFGRRGAFLVGLAVFGAGSVISGAASAPEALIAGRVVQGIGAAAMLTLSLALVSHAFSPADQGRAFGIWAGVSAIALGLGPLVGGLLVDLDWRVIFWVNVPLAALGVAIILWAATESRDETSGRRVDWVGLVVLSAALVALVLPLVEAQAWGWGSLATLGLLGVAAALAVVFWIVEHRVGNPIVDFSLFRTGPYFGASAAAFALVGAYWAVMFFQAQYLQSILGHSAVAAGVLILPVTVPMIVISPFAGRLIGRFGSRSLMTVGMVVGLAGVVVMTRITETSGYGLLFPGYLLFGIALGFVYAPMSAAAMAAMPRAKAGIAAGVLAMNRVLAGAVFLAVTSAVFQALQRDKLTDTLREG
jgi:EmrB/QacA subfamily drug resistance transporter